MDNEVLVTKLNQYINKQSKKDRHFNLAMLLDDDPTRGDSHFSLFLSSKWLDDKSPRQAVNEVIEDLIEEIGVASEEFKKISRVSVIKTTDPFVVTLTSSYNVCSHAVNIVNCNFNGLVIEKATLLESHDPRFEIKREKTRSTALKKQKTSSPRHTLKASKFTKKAAV